MTRDVTHVTIWDPTDEDSPSYALKNGTINVTDKYTKIMVPRRRAKRLNGCPTMPNGYRVLVSDESGDDPDGVIYSGEVEYTVILCSGSEPMICLKCEPAELNELDD